MNYRDQSHRLTHRRAPRHWHEGFPLGNGVCGAMLWGDGDPLCLTLDHAELWDLRTDNSFAEDPEYNYASLQAMVAEGRYEQAAEVLEARQTRDNPLTPTKLSIGRAELTLGDPAQYECALDLDRALVEGTIRTTERSQRLCAFVQRESNVVCLRVDNCPENAVLRLVPLAEACAEMASLGHSAPQLVEEGDLRLFSQVLAGGIAYALVWNASGPDYFVAIEVGDTSAAALARARATCEAAAARGFDDLRESHVAAWSDFWSASAVHLPEAEMELLWYYGLYLLAGAARRGHLPPGLQGLWAMDGVIPPWRGDYHADMNVQETFWPAGATGHLDLLDCWVDHMAVSLPAARDFTRRFFGTEGAFWPCAFLPHYTMNTCWSPVQFAWSNTGWLAWLVWLRWRYSLDKAWLRETGYPLLAETFRFYRANLVAEEDGCLHVPLSSSPEYRENAAEAWAKDPNADLALIRRACDWLVEAEVALGLCELSDSAREVHDRLVPYSLLKPTPPPAGGFNGDKVLALWPGQALNESHRHPSHLMAIHPAMDLTIEGDETQRQIISDSVAHFLELGQYRWAGHTYAQWASFAACLGRAGMAYDALEEFAQHWVGGNGLHVNRDQRQSGMSIFAGGAAPFTMEANCGFTMGVCDMLLQGWGDRLRVFPAVPEHWRDVAFEDLRAEGAFRVTAVRLGGETRWVRVVATTERLLRLRDPFAGGAATVTGADLQREGEDYVGLLAAGQEVVLAREGAAVTMAEAIAAIRRSDTSVLGLR